MRVIIGILVCFLFISNINAQSFAINTDGSTANTSAILDVKSISKGVLVPRMSKAEKNAIATPATGLLIFQNAPDSTGFYYYNGSSWLWLATATNAGGWLTTGNAGTDTAVNFIGTTDAMPIRFKQNNNWIGQFNSNNSNFFIGTNSGKNTTASTNTAFGANSLASNNIGIGNLGMGASAMASNTSASRNTAVGDSAMITQSFSNGGIVYFTDNTAIGSKALFYNDPTGIANGYKNTAVGSEALYQNTTGFENTAVGTGAMHDNITGEQNTAVGRSAYRLSKSGNFNAYIGFEAGYNDSLSSNNVGVGYRALRNSSNGQNTAVGSAALSLNTIGASNVSIGYVSLSSNTTGALNTAVGMNSMFSNVTGSNNVTVGALANVTTGNLANATAIGTRATVAQSNALVLGSINGINGATATINVGIGTNAPNASASLDITSTSRGMLIPRMSKAQKNAIVSPATGLMVFQNAPDSVGFHYFNGTAWLWMATATTVAGWLTTGNAGTDTAVNFIGTTTNMPLRFKQNGQWSGQFNSNTSNYFIGRNAGISITSGVSNSAFGGFALTSNTTGSMNTAMGINALSSNTTGTQNTAIGALSMSSHKTGGANVALGYNTIANDSSGNDNTAIGYMAMNAGGKPQYNTAVGSRSLQHTGENSTNSLEGNYNTALGYNSGTEIRRGFQNVAIGYNALSSDTSGTYNTIMGTNAAGDFQGGSRNVAIGYYAMNFAKGSNKVAIGQLALYHDTAATGNIAVGATALQFNYRGVSNIAMGMSALRMNISGSRNLAIGDSALMLQIFSVGNGINHFTNNTAVGYKALINNNPLAITNGIDNTAVGTLSGATNTSGSGNTFIGSSSDASSGILINSTAIGYQSYAAQNNSLVLGSINGVNNATASINVGIGTNTPDARLHILDNGNSGGSYTASSSLIIEDNANSYIQLSHPNTAQTGIFSGNASTATRSGIIFNADSSINIRTGGSTNRMLIDNTGFVGIRNAAPLSHLDVLGSTGNAISTSTLSTSLDQLDHTHIILSTGFGVTITLPAANTCARREYVIVNQDASPHVVSSYLDFTGTAVTVIPANSSLTVQSNGSNWYRIR